MTLSFTSIAANRINHGISFISSLNHFIFASGNLISILEYKEEEQIQEEGEEKSSQCASLSAVSAPVKGHAEKITCLTSTVTSTIQNGSEEGGHKERAAEFIFTGSADKTCILWKYNVMEKTWGKHCVLTGHQAAISAVAAMATHPSNENENKQPILYLASADTANTIKIWQMIGMDDGAVSCTQSITIAPHHCLALAFAFLPHSNTPVLFCGGSDLKLTFYTMEGSDCQFKKQASLAGHTDWIRSIKIATYTHTHEEGGHQRDYGFQDGDLMIATASQDKYIRIWKVSSTSASAALEKNKKAGTTDTEEHEQTSSGTADFDAQMIDAMDSLRGTQLSTKAHIFESRGYDDCSRPDASSVTYSAMLDAILLGHDDWVLSVNWQPSLLQADANGVERMHQPMQLVSSSADKSILIWTPDEYSESWIPKHRMGEVGGTTLGFYGALFAPNGSALLSNGYNGAIHIWKRKDKRGIAAAGAEVDTAAMTTTWAPSIGLSGHSQSVQDISWDPTGTFLLSTSLDQTSRIFATWKRENTAPSWHEIARSQIHGYNLQCCAFIDKYTYVSGADEKVLRIFEAPRNFAQSLKSICGIDELNEADISDRPIGANLPALGLSNKAVFEGKESEVNHDARLSAYTAGALASALTSVPTQPPFEEHLLQNTLWPEKEKLYGHGYEIIRVAASPDGKLIASACKATKQEHASVRLWSTEKWSSKYVLTAGRDRSWALFDISNATASTTTEQVECLLKQAAPKAHSRIIWSSCFTGDDSAFATASRDKTIKIWSLQASGSFELIETLKLQDSVTAIDIFSAPIDGCHVLAAGLEDGSIFLYYFTISEDKTSLQIKKQVQLPLDQTHSKSVKSLKWRPCSSSTSEKPLLQLASCSEDHSVRLFSIL